MVNPETNTFARPGLPMPSTEIPTPRLAALTMVLPASAPISDSGLPMGTPSAYVPGETRTVSFAAAAVIAAPMVALQPDEAAALTHHVAPVAGRTDTPFKISSHPPWARRIIHLLV